MTSPTFSQAGLQRLHGAMAGYAARGDAPGLVALVSLKDRMQVEAFGTKTSGGSDPVRSNDIFRISSMTKPVTAAATMILVEAGKLRLDDAIETWLPELANRQVLRRPAGPLDDTVPAIRPVTVRDLLTFAFGFGLVMAPPDDYPILREAMALGVGTGMPAPAVRPDPDEWLRRLGSLPLMHQPGEKWMYATGSDVLSVLVARVSGQSFDSFLHDELFGPLAMHDTGFGVPANKLGRFGPSYWINDLTEKMEVYDPPANGQWSRPPAFCSGGDGLVSTADDYLAFCRMLLNDGEGNGTRVLSPESIALMTSDQLTPAQKAGAEELTSGYFGTHGYGFGGSVVTRQTHPAEPVGQYGWDGGLGTSMRIDPRLGLTGILLTPTAWTSPEPPAICEDFWTLIYESVES